MNKRENRNLPDKQSSLDSPVYNKIVLLFVFLNRYKGSLSGFPLKES